MSEQDKVARLIGIIREYRDEARKCGWGSSSLDDIATAALDEFDQQKQENLVSQDD